MNKEEEVSEIVFVKNSQKDSLCENWCDCGSEWNCDWHCDSCECDDSSY